MRKHPHVLEIQIVHLLQQKAGGTPRFLPLKSVPDSYWQKIAAQGFNVIWLMGVWKRSPAALECALRYDDLWKACDRVIKGCSDEDFMGSPYAVLDYTLEPAFGTMDDLKELRSKLSRFGLRLILDFVSNHLALDHAMTETDPRIFLQAARENFEEDRPSYFKTKQGVFYAHGKDPYFPAWTDTVQVNYFSPSYREFCVNQILKIAEACDGVRCDMAMLGLNRIFKKGWSPFLEKTPEPAEEYWSEIIRAVKAKHPDFTFIAESYWDLEWELQQLGFDFTYDKRLYDRLLYDSALSIKGHLKAEMEFQNKSMRFIENHDEERAAKIFGVEKSQAAAVIMSTVPGMRFFHDGQLEGKMIHVPIQLIRTPQEKPVKLLKDFYQILLEYADQKILHEGTWQLLEVHRAWPEQKDFGNLLAWSWEAEGEVRLILVNYSAQTAQARVRLPAHWLKGETLTLHDKMASISYTRDVEELKAQGLYAALPAWKAHLFEFGI